jgi:hypothetical protein
VVVFSNQGSKQRTVCTVQAVFETNFTLRTYNCNELGDINKFGSVFTKLRKKVQSGGIALLQETHIIDFNFLNVLENELCKK